MSNYQGQRLGNYLLLDFLGSGGFGEVYLGRHILLENFAAIKILQAHWTEEGKGDFLAEARRLMSLNHAHIVRMLDFGMQGETSYLVMEHAAHGSLKDRHDVRSSFPLPLPIDLVVTYVQQIASALQYLHDHKLIHRDVKPANMLLGANDPLLLSDVGLAVVAHSTASFSLQTESGTPLYMAPEQSKGRAVPASDQYALGVVVYEWLCGSPPFTCEGKGLALHLGLREQHLHASPPSLRLKNPVIAPAVEAVVLRALAKDPGEPFADSNPSSARSTGERVPPLLTRDTPRRKAGSRGGLPIALVLFALLVIFAGTGYAVLDRNLSPTRPVVPSPATPTATPAATGSATITITPASDDLKKSYTISAVTGTPDPSKQQVAARYLSSPTPSYTETVNATGTGTTPATQAKGTLTFSINCCSGWSLVVPSGITWTGQDGTQVVNDQAVCLNGPTNSFDASATVSAHSVLSGKNDNIGAEDIHTDVSSNTQSNTGSTPLTEKGTQCACSTNKTQGNELHLRTVPFSGGSYLVHNSSAFSGGKDQQNYTFVRRSDINSAAHDLETAKAPNAQQAVQGQVHTHEQLVGTPQCQPKVTYDHAAGEVANTVTVAVTFTCSGEAYDQQGAFVAASQWLKQDAAQNPGAGYVLVGNIVTKQTDVQVSDTSQGTIAVSITAEGVWAYHIDDTQQDALAKLIAGKKKGIAQALLLRQQGIAGIDMQLSGSDQGTLPTDLSHIKLAVLSVPGKSS
jgi:serine/threonine protein kinase